MTVFSAIAYLPLWAKYTLLPDFVRFLWWLVWVRACAVAHFFHRRAVKQGVRVTRTLEKCTTTRPMPVVAAVCAHLHSHALLPSTRRQARCVVAGVGLKVAPLKAGPALFSSRVRVKSLLQSHPGTASKACATGRHMAEPLRACLTFCLFLCNPWLHAQAPRWTRGSRRAAASGMPSPVRSYCGSTITTWAPFTFPGPRIFFVCRCQSGRVTRGGQIDDRIDYTRQPHSG